MRNLPIEAKIVVFKTIAISKLAYLALLSVIPKLLSKLNIKFVTQIFRSDGTIKNWNNLQSSLFRVRTISAGYDWLVPSQRCGKIV